MFYVYAIRSTIRKYIYVGLSNNLQRRFTEHNKGYNKTTKPYAPFELIYIEECETRKAARIREKHFKSSIGKRFLMTL